jgi:hypothetical protein
MSSTLSFRDLAQEYSDMGSFAPTGTKFPAFWTVVQAKKNYPNNESGWHEELLKYLNDTIRVLLDYKKPYAEVQRLNTQLYRGRHWIHQNTTSNLVSERNKKLKLSRDGLMVLNYLGQVADNYTAEMAGYEPSLVVRPKNNEEQDKVSARMLKEALDHYFYVLDVKNNFLPFHLRTVVHGETFKFVKWDPNAGDLLPAYRELRDMKLQMGMDPDMSFPLVNPETGEQELNSEGEPIWISQTIKQGDLIITDEYSERVLYPNTPSGEWKDVPYIHQLLLMEVDEVKARWPKYADKLKGDTLYREYLSTGGALLGEYIVVRYTYHKPTEFLEKGFTCWSTEHCILQTSDKEFNHDDLPCIRGIDIQVPYETAGMSRFQNLATLNHAINSSTTSIIRNHQHFGYPKYAVPRGAKVRLVDLGDDRTVYEYSGTMKPELMTQNSTPADTWRLKEAMRDEFKTLAMLEGPQAAQAPAGMTANVALRMLEEQYRKLKKPAIDRHALNVQTLGRLMLATLGTYRDPEDGALLEVLGKNNQRALRYFDATSLSKPYSVELLKSSGLPDSPAAKTQLVMDLSDKFQGMFTNDEVLEYLDIARPEQLVEIGTIARQSAEGEVEEILAGMPVQPPQPYHDLLPRYRVFEKAVQSRNFDEADPMIKQRMMNHILGLEYLIAQKMKNPIFAQTVMEKHPNFPMVFSIQPAPMSHSPVMLAEGIPPPMLDPMMGQPQGDINAADLAGLPPEAGSPDQSMPPEGQALPDQPSELDEPMSPPEGQAPLP